MKSIQRVISFLLALVMVIGMVPPMEAYAEEMESTIETVAVETVEEETVVETTAATEEATPPTEAVTEPVEETTAPTVETIPEETVVEEIISSDAKNTSTRAWGKCGENLTWTLDYYGTLTISGTGEMYNTDVEADYQITYNSSSTFSYSNYEDYIVSVIIEPGVTSIGDGAFTLCEHMISLTIPNTVTRIGRFAFSSEDLQTVTIPASVTSIGERPFVYCPNLKEIRVDPQNPCYTSDGMGGLFSKDMTELIQVTRSAAGAYYKVPDGVTSIGDWAFGYYEDLTGVELPEGLTRIGISAFNTCTGLRDIKIPDSVTEIGNWAFCYCEALTSVNIPDGVTRIGYQTFCLCRNLSSVELSENLISIEWQAFLQCDSLTSVEFPESLERIGNSAFANCGLTSVELPAGLKSIDRWAFDYCVDLSSVKLPEGLVRIGVEAFGECTSLTEIEIPKSVTDIGISAFSLCTSLTDIRFKGNAPTIYSADNDDYKDVFPGVTATAYYPTGDDTWTEEVMQNFGGNLTWISYDPEDPTEYVDVFYYSEHTSGSSRPVHLYYKDDFFKNSSYTYNHDLAKATLKLAMSAFVADKSRSAGIDGDAKNAYDFLQKIGCDKLAIRDYGYAEEPTTDSIGCVIGSKQLKDQKETLLIVAVRGQGYGAEWGGNFRVGPNLIYHQGFEKAAERVLERINSYIESMDNISGPVKLWITGYSRAAATANIVAGKLINGQGKLPEKVKLDAENLFAYTFETPAGVRTSGNPHAEKYHNIFNIINSTDFVPKVTPAIWGYGRFGIDCFLPDLSSENYPEVYTTYKELTDKTYTRPFEASLRNLRQSLFLDLAIGKLAATVGGELGYVMKDQLTLINSCAAHKGLPSFDVIFNRCLAEAALINAESIALILEKAGQIKFGHYPENCLAMMETLTDESGYTDGKYKYYIVKCPVDISVTDDRGNVIAAIENDAVSRLGNKNVDVYVDENGDKYVFILDDTNYELQLMATDDGEMDCTVVSYQQGQGKTSQSAFFDVPLVEGESYTAPFSMEDDHYVLYSKEGILTPDVVVSGDELYNVAVHVEIVGSGAVTGAAECYTIGDTVNLTAVPEEGSIFGGWYADGELVSPDEEYVFGIQGDCTLTAVFLSNELIVTLDQEYVALQIGETAQLCAKVQPAELTELVQWSMEDNDETVASVDENGLLTAKTVGTTYVIASVTDGKTEFTARCRVDVAETDVKEDEQTGEEFPAIVVKGVQMATTKLTTELFSTDYAEFDIMLELPQNVNLMSTDRKDVPEHKGVAIDSVRFTADTTAVAFDLVALDDRRIAVVPTEYALENPKELKKSYKSAVTVWVDGEDYTTDEILTLTVKQSKPKLKAAISAFNSFYTGQTQEISITGGTATGITVKSLPNWLTPNNNGTLSLNEHADTKNSGKVVLLVETEEWNIDAEISLSVKNAYKAPGLKLNTSTVKIAESAAKAGINLQLQPKSKKDTLKSLDVADVLPPEGYKVEGFNSLTGSFTLKANNGFQSDKITLQVKIDGTTETVPLTLKVEIVKKNISVSFKASGNLDLSLPNQTVTVKPTFKNYSGSFTFTETETEQFKLKQDGNVISVQCKEGTKPGTYVVPMKLTRDDGQAMDGSVELTVKQTAIKLKLSSSKLSLNSTISDQAFVTVTCTTKGYDLKDPIVNVMDKSGNNPSDGVTTDYNNGKLTVSVNGNTKPDTAYKVLVKAYEGAPAATLTVSTLKANKSTITASLKLSGSLDVIRDGTSITVTPSYKNCSNTAERTETLLVLDKDGMVIADSSWEENTILNIQKDTQGRYILTRVSGAKLDHTQKYTVKLTADFGSNAPVTAEKAMKLKMGSTKLTLKSDSNILFSRDSYSRVNFSLTAKDVQLNDISDVKIKADKNQYDKKLEIVSYGNGEYALGFANNTVDKSLQGKTITITLNISLEGNETDKPNTTAKLKLTILK